MERLRDSWTVTPISSSGGGYSELEIVAAALNLPFDDNHTLAFQLNRLPFTIALDINSGSVVGINFTVKLESRHGLPDGPFLTLRSEKSKDVRDKDSGLVKEVQLGDPAFDLAVFIDSDATDEEVRRVMSPAPTREAVQVLLKAGVGEVKLTREALEVKFGDKKKLEDRDFVLTMVEALTVIARGGGPRGIALPRHGAWMVPAFILTNIAAAGICYLAVQEFFGGVTFPLLAFFIVGTVLSAVARPFIRSAVAGDSGSGSRASLVLFLFFVGAGTTGATFAISSNALLSEGLPVRVVGTVESADSTSDDDDWYHASIRWPNGNATRERFAQPPIVGSRVVRSFRKGFFGVNWGEHIQAD